ncbi:MAG: DegV family EDD domain-containing protein, partial [Halanaerobiales bacterium]|nr:DegV family EDD domain-containing protein [Halanaerobiales bacterium]
YAFVSGAKEVIENKKELNKINLFPVPDGDTGTNLSRTLNMVVENVRADKSITKTLSLMSNAALQGAIGNSGIIFAQFINGLKVSVKSENRINVSSFVEIINNAVDYTYKAINEPVEGTILTVMNDWSKALGDVKRRTDDFEVLMSESLKTAQRSLASTKETLEVLKQANVVDSGALGFIFFLNGILNFIKTGEIKNVKSYNTVLSEQESEITQDEEINLRYCTEAYIEKLILNKDKLRAKLCLIGDSLIIAGDNEKMRIHIHTNQPDQFFNILNKYCNIIDQKVDDMLIQYNVKYNKLANIGLITDSIADLPQEYIDDNQIHVVPINLIIDGTKYLDKITINSDRFFELTDKAKEYPTSSQPSLKYVEDKLSFLADHYDSLIIITVSSNLSGTYDTIKKAAEKIDNSTKISIIDSKLDSGAQGLLVLEAAEKIKNGEKHNQIINYLEKIKENIYIYVSVDNFEYMVRGGRVSPLKGKLAKLFNLKPIISLDHKGNGIAFAKAFSKSSNNKKIKEIVKKHLKNSGIKRYSIVHGAGLDRAKNYKKIFTKLIGKEPDYIESISPVIALSAGKGSVAISVLTEER